MSFTAAIVDALSGGSDAAAAFSRAWSAVFAPGIVQVTSEMYEDLNSAWLEVRQYDYPRIESGGVSEFLEWVKMRSHLFRGVTFGTMLRDEAYHFIRLGTHLERAHALRAGLGQTDAETAKVGEHAGERLAAAGRRTDTMGDPRRARLLLQFLRRIFVR